MDLTEIAKEYNVSEDALKSLTEYLVRNISENPEIMELFRRNPNIVIRQGVKAWRDSSIRFFAELLENKTERAQNARKTIAKELYNIAQQRKNVK